MKLQHQNQAKELDIKFQHQENDYINCVCCEDNWRKKKKANLSKICLQLLEDKKIHVH